MKAILALWGMSLVLFVGCSDSPSTDVDGGTDGDSDSDSDGDSDSDADGDFSYPVVDTNQLQCWDDNASQISCDGSGQDGEVVKNAPSYTDNGDGTVTDNVTGLMWQKGMDEKMNFSEGESYCAGLGAGGYDDWRVPSVKELYSLMDFSGATGLAAPDSTEVPPDAVPYIDTDFFEFEYGDGTQGERYIDAQWLTTTIYVSQVMNGQECSFGVNHADGRIKCYPTQDMGDGNFRFRCVRGKTDYGVNDFVDNGDGTVSDLATGLTWMLEDSAGRQAGDLQDGTMDWYQAIAYCEGLDMAGHDDWRLPDAKELQSIVDYTRSPDTTDSAALDPVFEAGEITNEMGDDDYGYYWASTTHLDGPVPPMSATYVSFGRAIGQMQETTMDVHGAGAQRSDPKTGDRADYPALGMGPQGDSQRVFNLVRCVRD